MARGLKFPIKEVEGLYYLCSENKGADQLRGYGEADLCLCFRICKIPVFSQRKAIYRKVPKFSDARKLCCNLPKIQTKSPNLRVFSQKDANGIANSEDPDQTAPLGAV